LVPVVSALQMYEACLERFGSVDGVIAAAAVADFRPANRREDKMSRSAGPVTIELVPNPDILQELGRRKKHYQWTVGFALELQGSCERAKAKLQQKLCDAIVVNDVASIESAETAIQLLDWTGEPRFRFAGSKEEAAERIVAWIEANLATRQDSSGALKTHSQDAQ